MEPEIACRGLDHTGRDEHEAARAAEPAGAKARLPVPQIAGPRFGGVWPPVTWRQVLEQLDPRPRGGAERGDAQARPEDRVQPLLLRPVVLALAGDPEPQPIAVEGHARVRIGDHDRGVVDAEEEAI